MIDSRNQFKTTKDGAITYAKKDVDLAYAHGFKSGRASERNNVSPFTLSLCQKMAGKSLIEMYMSVLHEEDWSITDNKMNVLERLNAVSSTNYDIQKLNRWISNANPVPKQIQSYMRDFVIGYIFGDDIADMLAGMN